MGTIIGSDTNTAGARPKRRTLGAGLLAAPLIGGLALGIVLCSGAGALTHPVFGEPTGLPADRDIYVKADGAACSAPPVYTIVTDGRAFSDRYSQDVSALAELPEATLVAGHRRDACPEANYLRLQAAHEFSGERSDQGLFAVAATASGSTSLRFVSIQSRAGEGESLAQPDVPPLADHDGAYADGYGAAGAGAGYGGATGYGVQATAEPSYGAVKTPQGQYTESSYGREGSGLTRAAPLDPVQRYESLMAMLAAGDTAGAARLDPAGEATGLLYVFVQIEHARRFARSQPSCRFPGDIPVVMTIERTSTVWRPFRENERYTTTQEETVFVPAQHMGYFEQAFNRASATSPVQRHDTRESAKSFVAAHPCRDMRIQAFLDGAYRFAATRPGPVSVGGSPAYAPAQPGYASPLRGTPPPASTGEPVRLEPRPLQP